MSSKHKNRTLQSTITAAALSKVIMSEQNTKDSVDPVTPPVTEPLTETTAPVVLDKPDDIIATDATASEEKLPEGTESNADDSAEETSAADTESADGEAEGDVIEGEADTSTADETATETPVADLVAAIEASDVASAAAALEPIAPATIAPELDVIAPPVELAVQAIEEGSVLPPYLARQRGYLSDYARVMGRDNRPSSQEMGIQQRNLYQVLIMLFDLDGTDFITALDDLLQFINKNRDFMFADKYIFRAMDVIAVDYAGTQVFKQLMVLLVKIADPQDRALIRNHLDLNTAVRNVRNGERALSLITEFLNI